MDLIKPQVKNHWLDFFGGGNKSAFKWLQWRNQRFVPAQIFHSCCIRWVNSSLSAGISSACTHKVVALKMIRTIRFSAARLFLHLCLPLLLPPLLSSPLALCIFIYFSLKDPKVFWIWAALISTIKPVALKSLFDITRELSFPTSPECQRRSF